MTDTAPPAASRTPIETELVRADRVKAGDRVGRFGDLVTRAITSDGVTSIALETPHGYAIADGEADRLIQVAANTIR